MDLLNFKTYSFIIFLFVSLVAYYVVPKNKQWIVLVAANLLFYFNTGLKNFAFIILNAVSSFILARFVFWLNICFIEKKKSGNYTKDELKIEKAKILRKKRIFLILMIFIGFGILFFLKYWNTLVASLGFDFLHAGGTRGMLLPLGISFYTFQTFAYFMDVYNGKYECEKSFLRYFCFVSFFPQLIMGPINRYDAMGKQMEQEHPFNFENIKKGMLLVLFGAMKKYCIADMLFDRIGSVLDQYYSNIPGILVVTSILFYSAYQYADFSGGIDMVTGFAKMFGIDMAPNFRQPYFATTLGDFWRRWHISLGAWMKDYIFYPFAFTKEMQNLSKKFMSMKNKSLGKHLARTIPAGLGNIIVFLFVGVWHGPEMHFVVWGLYNGLVIAFSDLFKPAFEKINVTLRLPVKSYGFKVFQIIRTFIIVNIGWYFDRIVDIRSSFLYLKKTFTHLGPFSVISKDYLKNIYGSLSNVESELSLVFAGCVVTFVVSILRESKVDVYDAISKKNIAIRWGTYYMLMLLIVLSLSFAPGVPSFMYAQY